MNNKKGGLVVSFCLMLFIAIMILFFLIFLSFIQLNMQIQGIKEDVFFVCQNAVLAYDYNELAYENYRVDLSILKQSIISIFNKNYLNSQNKIQEIKILEIYSLIGETTVKGHTNNRILEPIIHIKLEVKFAPITKLVGSEIKTVVIHDDVKLSTMRY